MEDNFHDNVIEWMQGDRRATLSLSQKKQITRVLQLAKDRPDECEIVALNRDGSICAHVPSAWVKILPTRQLTEEERQRLSDQMKRNIGNVSISRDN
jgi:hypothetical protein